MLNEQKIRNIICESIAECIQEHINESAAQNMNYTHLAVNKQTNLIVDGWDYSDEDPADLKQFKRDYFMEDLINNGFNPKAYKIITVKFADKNGIDKWSNTGVYPMEEENKMKQEGQNPFELAYQEHPDWFSENA